MAQYLNKKAVYCSYTAYYIDFAEREGFKPPVPCSTAVFKTAAIDHSAISPECAFFLRRCKDTAFSETTKP